MRLNIEFRGPLEATSFVRVPKIDPPGAPGMVFDLWVFGFGLLMKLNMSNGPRSVFVGRMFLLEARGTKAKNHTF